MKWLFVLLGVVFGWGAVLVNFPGMSWCVILGTGSLLMGLGYECYCIRLFARYPDQLSLDYERQVDPEPSLRIIGWFAIPAFVAFVSGFSLSLHKDLGSLKALGVAILNVVYFALSVKLASRVMKELGKF